MLEAPDSPKEPTPKELEIFRTEIAQLYEDERNKKTSTGHFTNPFDKTKVFRKEDLGSQEFLLWQSFQDCQTGVTPISYCLRIFNDYRQLIGNEEISLAKSGLISYVGNKLASLSGREQLGQQQLERLEQRKRVLMIDNKSLGEMREWFNRQSWKDCVGVTLPRVRIPLSPPSFLSPTFQ